MRKLLVFVVFVGIALGVQAQEFSLVRVFPNVNGMKVHYGYWFEVFSDDTPHNTIEAWAEWYPLKTIVMHSEDTPITDTSLDVYSDAVIYLETIVSTIARTDQTLYWDLYIVERFTGIDTNTQIDYVMILVEYVNGMFARWVPEVHVISWWGTNE